MKRLPLISTLAFAVAFAFVSQLGAQVGNNNPGGVAGVFNGQITTGCSYDPYTGNATRAITDIAVAGAVGDYPLALVRTANSRSAATAYMFERPGGWNHNYNWYLEDSPTVNNQSLQPANFTVDFPDGRVESFRAVTWDSYYRVRPGLDPPQGSSAGVRERFQPLSNGYCNLILPDGGKVKFYATQHQLQNQQFYYSYQTVAIIDPHGLQTTLTYETTGAQRLLQVTEPAGRYLQFTYDPYYYWRISQVTASDGRRVNYWYAAYDQYWQVLDHVAYYTNNPNNNWTARYRYCAANIYDPNHGTQPLLWTADDPMYPGPMKRIAYDYKPGGPNDHNPDGSTPAYGQILNERYWDGNTQDPPGAIVSTLTVGAPNNPNIRTETRGDTRTRTFNYSTDGYLQNCTDFMNHSASQGYDSYKYINYVVDRNAHRTDYTSDPVTGNVTQIQLPLTPGDTPDQGNTRPTVNYTYTNNYYLYTVQDEGNHTTTFTRDGNNRVTRIDYPDGGYETFSYDAAHFYQISSHRMVTGGTETFAYDGFHRRQYYSDPYHSNPGNFSIQYFYDGLDRVNGVFDTLWHPTNWDYNDRGQVTVTTLPTDPSDNYRHTITNAYNPDGTLQSRTDQLNHLTNYTYDGYRRLKTVTLPVRGFGDNSPHTTSFFYDANGVGDDYRFTDSSVTYVTFPSGKRIKTIYNDNRRKTSVTVGYGTADAATTSYGYDNAGNVTSVTNPLNHNNVSTVYDERNRPSSTSIGGQPTTLTYDTAGRRKTITRPDGQLITYNAFDAMNRMTQQTATNAGTTKYTYYPSGLLNTMQDPRLVANSSAYKYTYSYDNMGRKTQLQYPPDSLNVQRTEQWSYDTVGRLQTFINRNQKTQTFSYDALNRMTGFSWNDNGLTPSVTFGYDAASRLTSINNANANISRAYFNDNLLRSETESITGGSSKTVTYFYDADGNRTTTQYPDTYTFNYTYTGRNQLKSVTNYATYDYDARGNLTTRTLVANGRQSTYGYDSLDRVTSIQHLLNGTTRTLNYGYYPNSNNRKWTKHEDGYGDAFGYDLADQVTAVLLDVQNPDTTSVGDQSIFYDGSGNRTVFRPYESQDAYTVNDLNQYTGRTESDNPLRPTPTPRPPPSPPPSPTPPGQQPAVYDYNGNMTSGFDGSTYLYDAQNRLLSATRGTAIMTFAYDGLSRQVSRTATGVGEGPSGTTFSVWDGWDLIEEYQSGNNVTGQYLYGTGGLIKNLTTNNYYYQDASGSTSHLADSNGNLLEWYRYDLQGTPVFYDANNNQRTASAYGVRHLFTGQQWYSDAGLYDLRNRFYSPDIGRFLQPDPIDFNGDPTNLYRYCGNNPVTGSDPDGETVYLSQHSVALFGNHTWLTIVPSDLGSFAGSGSLYNGALTISGQPIGGYVNMTINSNIKSVANYVTIVQPPDDMTAEQFDNAVYNAAISYPQNTYAYFFLPELGAAAVYNSNGFTVYVLLQAGLHNAQAVVDNLPGWQTGSGQSPGYDVIMSDGSIHEFDSDRNYIGQIAPGGGILGSGSGVAYLGNLALRSGAEQYWGGSYGGGYGGGGGSGAYGGGAGIGFGSIGFYGASLGLPGSFGIWGGGSGQSPGQPPREL
jgi:RHS repeat-associated protein